MLRRISLSLIIMLIIACVSTSGITASADTAAANEKVGIMQDVEKMTLQPVLPVPETTEKAEPVKPDAAIPESTGMADKAVEPAKSQAVNEDVISISFAGDCTLGTDTSFSYDNSFTDRFVKEDSDYSYFFRNVKPIFEADDLTLVNLETTLTNAKKPAVKQFRFKGDPSYVNILKAGAVEAVNIANNHIHDYLAEGFEDTVKALDGGGILYSGWDKTAYQTIRGVTVAMIGYTIWDTGVKAKVLESIEAAAEKADIIIVSFHWGEERVNYASKYQRELAHFCIDHGADAVIGHHPHVIQGIESYKERYIVYSLGNFCFGGNRNPTDKDCIIFQDKFFIKQGKLDRTEAEVIPCSISSVGYINNYQPAILYGEEKERVLQRVKKYSEPYNQP